MIDRDPTHRQEDFNPEIEVVIIQGDNDPEYTVNKEEIERIRQQGEFLNYDTSHIENWRSFSLIDERDKYTERLVDCTGVVIFGRRKDSDKIISCIAHTDEISALSGMTDLVSMSENIKAKDKRASEWKSEISDLRNQLSHTTPDEEVEVYDDVLEMEVIKNKKEYLQQQLLDLEMKINLFQKDALGDGLLKLEAEVQKNLSAFKALVDLTTVSASIIGGQSLREDRTDSGGIIVKMDTASSERDRDGYRLAVGLWRDYIITNFGLEPSIAHEPLAIRGKKHGTDVYVDTQGKKIFVVYRTAQNNTPVK